MNGGMNAFRQHYLMVALIPVKDPELVMMVVETVPGYSVASKESPEKSRAAMDIMAQVVALQRVMKNLADMMSPKEKEETNYASLSSVEKDSPPAAEGPGSEDMIETLMPSLKGMSVRKSLRLLQSVGVSVEVVGTGRVVSQQPAAGTVLQSGMTVTLTLKQDQVEPENDKDAAVQQ